MNKDKILNIGLPVVVGFIGILAIGYGKTLYDDINTKPKRQLTSTVDLSEARSARKSLKQYINSLEEKRTHASLLFAKNNNGKINHDDLKMIRSLKPETLKEFIVELETDNLAGAKNKLKHKTSNRKSHKHKKNKSKRK